MIKILVVITTGFTITGGLTTVMMNYYHVMNDDMFHIDFASSNQPEEKLLDELRLRQSRYFKLPARKSVLNYMNAIRKLCKGYDVIHVHGNSATSILELLPAQIAGVKKRIAHNHTSRTQHPYINRLLHPFFLHTYTQAVACSREAGEWLFGMDKFTILPNAIDTLRFQFIKASRNEMRMKWGIDKSDFVIGHIGKFMDAKNHFFILDLFAAFHKIHPQSKLLLVGDGCLREQIEKRILQNKLRDSVILAGLREDIPLCLQAMDIFILPSLYEGMPLSAVEAQASGLPCILSDRVTSLASIGMDVKQVSLDLPLQNWVEAIENTMGTESKRESRCRQNSVLIKRAHFDIRSEANELAKIYLS